MIAELFCQLLLINKIILTSKIILFQDHIMEDHAAISHTRYLSSTKVCWASELQHIKARQRIQSCYQRRADSFQLNCTRKPPNRDDALWGMNFQTSKSAERN
eukprot:TRINITY_DN16033_c0_g1_i1.p1 TRINITY_DN16033_c0_g1~~TRINITY_DN16033_c0_g1_i1.p1  ORF type:complete len:102 (+),score=9.34 TRINITY_DN16033_c0_g1_i1:400-705(+)